jgi:radical SAM superfamily enzyme YgiQ (UPF0313 family)
MARVLLVKASHLDLIEHAVVPPLGLLYLAAVLRERSAHRARVLDLRLHFDWENALAAALLEHRPDVVGISALTTERRHLAAVADLTKRLAPNTRVIAGGPHPTALPFTCVRHAAMDAVVAGEGEEVIVPLVDRLVDCSEVESLPGVYTARSDATAPVRHAPPPDVESLPLPAWDLIELSAYHRRPSMSTPSPWRYAPISTSRGCPYPCSYCHSCHGKRHRARSVASVQAELELLGRRLGEGVIEVVDDAFNFQWDRAGRILELFARGDGRLRPSFPNGLRADALDESTVALLARSRTPFVSFGIESGCVRVQRRIGKDLDLEQARRAIGWAADRGIYCNGFFMLGFPTETAAEMVETIRFAVAARLDQAHFFRVIPFPGTRLWRELGPRAPQIERELETTYYTSRINLSTVPDWELEALWRLAYASFYLRPRQLLRLGRGFPNRAALASRAWRAALVLAGHRPRRR